MASISFGQLGGGGGFSGLHWWNAATRTSKTRLSSLLVDKFVRGNTRYRGDLQRLKPGILTLAKLKMWQVLARYEAAEARL